MNHGKSLGVLQWFHDFHRGSWRIPKALCGAACAGKSVLHIYIGCSQCDIVFTRLSRQSVVVLSDSVIAL